MKELIFYYDVICPYAYLASRLIEGIADAAGAKIRWKPVLLGGIYKATKPKNETKTKAYESMSPSKQLILMKDLMRLYSRHNVPCMPFHRMPDVNTLKPMRLLAACEDENSAKRKQLTHNLYNALWAEKRDVSDVGVLQQEVSKINWNVDVYALANGDDPLGKNALFANTQEAVERGAFGVPSFWVNNRLYYGCDRLHFVKRELGMENATPHRLLQAPIEPAKKRKLRIFHDFASPWSFMAHRHLPSLIQSLRPADVEVEWIPVVFGAIFQYPGHSKPTEGLPILASGKNKRDYIRRDFNDWLHYLSINDFEFAPVFPIKTLTALRMAIVNPDEKLRAAIYDAAWTKSIDIGNDMELESVVRNAGFDPKELFNATQSQSIKDKLKENTDRAISLGCCGVPSFQVDDQPIIWGQDRLNIVADEICGWQDDTEEKLAASKL